MSRFRGHCFSVVCNIEFAQSIGESSYKNSELLSLRITQTMNQHGSSYLLLGLRLLLFDIRIVRLQHLINC